MRLQKFIANSGVTSRRKAEELIKEGRVKVNGKIINKLGTKINPECDIVEVDGKRIEIVKKKIYVLLNKPEGYVTTLKDSHNDNIVLDLIKGINQRIFPVGRLDKDTSGLLIMTNDGDLAYKLTHPSHGVWKKYIVLVKGHPSKKEIEKIRKGIYIDGKKTSKAYVKLIKKYDRTSKLEISIHEGRNRQIRKMCEHIGHPVISLKRIAIGNININGLKKGQWRYLTKDEINYLKGI